MTRAEARPTQQHRVREENVLQRLITTWPAEEAGRGIGGAKQLMFFRYVESFIHLLTPHSLSASVLDSVLGARATTIDQDTKPLGLVF